MARNALLSILLIWHIGQTIVERQYSLEIDLDA